MLIRTMGLFWKRAHVFWGKGNNAGALGGVWSRGKRQDPVDFWDQAGVYALYADYQLVYVGQTGTGRTRLGQRLRRHTRDYLAGRWDSFSWFGVCQVLKHGALKDPPSVRNAKFNEILDILEGVVIAVGEPPLNRQGGRFGKGVRRYLQVRDERLGPTAQEAVADILNQIGRMRKDLRD